MWNEYSSPYGNEYSASSPWNEYSSSTSVPVLVDRRGNFFGFFTINEYRSNAVDFAGQLNKIYKMHDGDVEEVRKTLCDWIKLNHTVNLKISLLHSQLSRSKIYDNSQVKILKCRVKIASKYLNKPNIKSHNLKGLKKPFG